MHKNEQIKFDITSIAPQAHGVLASIGGTTVLCTCVVGEPVMTDSAPLSVHYVEKFSAVNRIPGGYKKREGSLSDHEILITRAIDRALRATIGNEFFHEINVVVQALSWDGYSMEVLAIAAASLGLNLAHVTNKLVAASRITGTFENKAIRRISDIAGSCDMLQAISEDKIVMLEFMGNKSNASLLRSALTNSINSVTKMQAQGMVLAKEIIKLQEKALMSVHHKYDSNKYNFHLNFDSEIEQTMNVYVGQYIQALETKSPRERDIATSRIKSDFSYTFETTLEAIKAKHKFQTLLQEAFTDKLLSNKKRLDGRKFEEVRLITLKAKFLPAIHGSALFNRGDTQALVCVTVGQSLEAQSIESLHGVHKENFLLHYNFPQYAVAKVAKHSGGISRREIGHGELARKAILPMLPEKLKCVIRVISDITSSNGSSSMATVCGASLALFDAGVDLSAHVAGVSIGLLEKTRGKKTTSHLLADITACEDMLGKMDFKIAATKKEITALQLDIKNSGITPEIFKKALLLGSKRIKEILEKMYKEIKIPNKTLHGVKEVVEIPTSKIYLVIGKSGGTVNQLQDAYNVKIDVDKRGKVYITPGNSKTTSDDIDNVIKKIKELIK